MSVLKVWKDENHYSQVGKDFMVSHLQVLKPPVQFLLQWYFLKEKQEVVLRVITL